MVHRWDQQGDLGNDAFADQHIRGRGALGDYFTTKIRFKSQINSTLKMGDTPSVAYLLANRTPEDPSRDSWGGRFVRAWDRRRYVFERAPSAAVDQVETYSIVEIIHRLPAPAASSTKATLVVDEQEFPGFADQAGVWHFLFSPKVPKKWDYTIRSTDPKLDGQTGRFTSTLPAPKQPASPRYPNWWTDDPDPAVAEGDNQGAKTVSRWRAKFLRDFAQRMQRCESAAPHP
jgi:hypothetical protein